MPNHPRLNHIQRGKIDKLAQRYPHNLAEPPKSLEDVTVRAEEPVTLGEFIEASDWDYAAVDVTDRSEVDRFEMEDFWRHVGQSSVVPHEPRGLSPVTVAKLIIYGVHLVGVIFENNIRGFIREDPRIGRVIDWALQQTASPGFPEEANLFLHFQMLMKHPIINSGVRNAAWHHYRLPD
jgi:hypothetical protein